MGSHASRQRRHRARKWTLALGVGLSLILGLTGLGLVGAVDAGDQTQGPSTAPEATPPQMRADAPTPTAASVRTAVPSVRPSPTNADPEISAVGTAQWREMKAAGMVYQGCPLERGDLRRMQTNYVDFDGEVRRGTLVVNRDVAASVARIFTALFEARYPIERIRPVEEYGGDDNASMRANNTSGYNCRHPDQINAPQGSSPHANGRAVDINPVQNPWVDPRCDCWFPSDKFAERTDRRGVIRRGDKVWRLFIDEGWIWQNTPDPDYMHFDTGFPSRPYDAPRDRRE